MKRFQGIFSWVVIFSELSHVFCCVFPGIFSVLSVLVGMGLIGIMPLWMNDLHSVMHNWEVPVMTASGVIVLLGWTLHYVSQKIDCHDTGCHHPPCEPKKKKSAKILKLATILFIVNVVIYVSLHMSERNNFFNPQNTMAADQKHDH